MVSKLVSSLCMVSGAFLEFSVKPSNLLHLHICRLQWTPALYSNSNQSNLSKVSSDLIVYRNNLSLIRENNSIIPWLFYSWMLPGSRFIFIKVGFYFHLAHGKCSGIHFLCMFVCEHCFLFIWFSYIC